MVLGRWINVDMIPMRDTNSSRGTRHNGQTEETSTIPNGKAAIGPSIVAYKFKLVSNDFLNALRKDFHWSVHNPEVNTQKQWNLVINC